MKKLVLLLAVVFSVSLFSCGNANKDAKAADSTADTTAVVDSAATDSAKVGLHASKLTIINPLDKKEYEFISPYPQLFDNLFIK
jgi:hypothetical protein